MKSQKLHPVFYQHITEGIKAFISKVFISKTKLYRKEPEKYRGHVGDVASFIRVAVTGRMNSPDLYEVINILGEDRMRQRILDETELLK